MCWISAEVRLGSRCLAAKVSRPDLIFVQRPIDGATQPQCQVLTADVIEHQCRGQYRRAPSGLRGSPEWPLRSRDQSGHQESVLPVWRSYWTVLACHLPGRTSKGCLLRRLRAFQMWASVSIDAVPAAGPLADGQSLRTAQNDPLMTCVPMSARLTMRWVRCACMPPRRASWGRRFAVVLGWRRDC